MLKISSDVPGDNQAEVATTASSGQPSVPPARSLDVPPAVRCCVMVLNYNGLQFLEECFATLLEAAARASVPCTVVCVDNRSTQDDVAWMRQRFPSVEVIVARHNDFLFSLNDVVRTRDEEVVLILNNDMRFAPNFIDPLLAHFADPTVFACNARIVDWDGVETQNAPRRARLHNFWFYKWWDANTSRAAFTIEAGGGASAYHRGRFVALGGFDDLYRPGYYEDFDLTYRAWERGWKSVYEPRSLIYHRVSASMVRELGVGRQGKVIWRNHVLFTIKCIGGIGFLLAFLSLLPFRAIRPLLRGDTMPSRATWAALPRIPKALRRRWVNRVGMRSAPPSASQIFEQCTQPLP